MTRRPRKQSTAPSKALEKTVHEHLVLLEQQGVLVNVSDPMGSPLTRTKGGHAFRKRSKKAHTCDFNAVVANTSKILVVECKHTEDNRLDMFSDRGLKQDQYDALVDNHRLGSPSLLVWECETSVFLIGGRALICWPEKEGIRRKSMSFEYARQYAQQGTPELLSIPKEVIECI